MIEAGFRSDRRFRAPRSSRSRRRRRSYYPIKDLPATRRVSLSCGAHSYLSYQRHPRLHRWGRVKIVHVEPDCRDHPSVRVPHQFRTRNDLAKAERTRSISDENAKKSTKVSRILPLITVWLQRSEEH